MSGAQPIRVGIVGCGEIASQGGEVGVRSAGAREKGEARGDDFRQVVVHRGVEQAPFAAERVVERLDRASPVAASRSGRDVPSNPLSQNRSRDARITCAVSNVGRLPTV